MKPFLLLATRAEDAAADGEYAAFLEAGGLEPPELVRVRLESQPLPDLDLDDYSGIVVGGSPFNASDPVESKSAVQRRVERELDALLDTVVATDFPFLGACYGVGLLGTHQNGTVDRQWPEPVGPTRVTVTPDGLDDGIFDGLGSQFDAFVGHKEACAVLPAGATLLATGTACPIQAFRIKSNVYATQFHPELTVTGIVERIRVYRDYGYFAPDEMDDLIQSIESAPFDGPSGLVRSFVERYAR
ncbi:glutamine amidotransferase [Marisediminicola sp. LYQ85]|uniref:glutamine amidotransferase n=1 Tax=Marisediminicola sp. LYQ85 TaxID=3391062 RepID=UPI00398331A7